MKEETAGDEVRKHGIPSIAFIEKMTGVNRSTLYNWYDFKPKLFKILILGVKTELRRIQDET